MSQRPLRILVDARMLIGRFSGVSRYVTRLIDALAWQDGIEVVALCGRGGTNPWAYRDDVEAIVSSFGRADRVVSRRVEWEGLYLRQVIRDSGADVFHATWNTGIPACCPVPSVLTIHDLIPWRTPEGHFATRWQRACYRYAQKASARRALRIITVSNHVRKQVIHELGVSDDKIRTTYNGVVPPAASTGHAPPIPHRFVLYVGGHESRKNIAGLFDAMQVYWNEYDERLLLHLTGDSSTLDDAAQRAFARMTGRHRIVFLGNIDDRELARQYTSAAAMVTLSFDEGFGLPVLEAMAYGCPVVVANRAALPEVVGSAGILVDLANSQDIVAGIHRAVVPSDSRSDLVTRGYARAKHFSWRRTAESLRGTYESVISASVKQKYPRAALVSG